MSEPVDWTADGSPMSPRYGDCYRSRGGGLAQARQVFMAGCGLPGRWRNQHCHTVLETGFGLGLNFLALWQAWRDDPHRPRMLHFVSVEAHPVAGADLLRGCADWPDLQPLAAQLAAQWWGLLPGVHRLSFEGGRVLLTLAIGDAATILPELSLHADSVFLDGFSPERNPDLWSAAVFQAIARRSRHGTRVATWSVARVVRDGLTAVGFAVERRPGLPPKSQCLAGVFQQRRPAPPAVDPAVAAIVVGAGLAGAACAASLARRGHPVRVVDVIGPGGGASGLPVGIFAPHLSPDDAPLSRLTRAGLRMLRAQAEALGLGPADWHAGGTLLHRTDARHRPPPAWQADLAEAAADWTHPATAGQRAAAGLAGDAPALWHPRGGWLRPAALVHALLSEAAGGHGRTPATGGAGWHGPDAQAFVLRRRIDAMTRTARGWRLDTDSDPLEAPLLVIAAGAASAALIGQALAAGGVGRPPAPPLQALRGQITGSIWPKSLAELPFPVHGHGSFVALPDAAGGGWWMGSTFDRSCNTAMLDPADDQANLQKLDVLLPGHAGLLRRGHALAPRAWAGVRCTVPDRLPLVGPLDEVPGSDRDGACRLLTCTALGARGITLAVLCGELLAAGLHAEPLPLPTRLARALRADRFTRGPAGAESPGSATTVGQSPSTDASR